jgi:dolichyl-phosphate beta-glucosyltransferase
MGLSRRTVVVVPCYNEASRLNCEAFESALAGEENLEFIFVNDGSRDETGERLMALRRRAGERAHVLDLEHNSGKAEAVRQGVLRAFQLDAGYIGYWDADLSTPLDCIESFAGELEARNVSLILGSRVLLLGRNIVRSPWRHYVGRVFATLASLSLGFAVYDTQCGAKLFRATDALRDVFSRPFEVTWTFDVELLERLDGLRNSSYRFEIERECAEYPLPQWIDTPGSKLNPAQYPKILGEVARLAIRRLLLRR